MRRLGILMAIVNPAARELAIHLASRIDEVHVIDFSTPPNDQAYLRIDDPFMSAQITRLRSALGGVHLIDTAVPAPARYVSSGLRLRRLLRSLRIEALLILYAGGYALLALVSGFRPYALYYVGSDILLLSRGKRALARLTASRAAALFANGHYLADRACELTGRQDIQLLYIGVDTHRFRPGELSPAPVHIVCVRGFAPVYNNEAIIRALALLPAGLPPFWVTFAAGGPLMESGRLLADQLLPEWLRERVVFLGGVDHDRILTVLRGAHIFVSMARSDGTSSALLEAMACGLFPVLSDIPQNREWVNSATMNGHLVPQDSPNALARALQDAIERCTEGQKWRFANRQLVVQRANIRRTAASLAEGLEALRETV